MIIVSGASGNVGGAAARFLAEAGHPVRLLVRDPARAPALPGAEISVADFGDESSLARVLGPGDKVFLVAVHADPDERIVLHRTFLQAAARASVGQLVYLSCLSASLESRFPHSGSHRATEEMVRACDLPFTFLRMSLFFTALASEFENGVMRGPGGDGRVSWVSREDVGAVVAAVLTAEGHEGNTYDVTGTEAPTLTETAAMISDVCGAEFRYEDETGADAVAWRIAQGYSNRTVRVWTGMYEGIQAGEFAPVSDVIERVTGRAPLSLREFVAAHRDDFLAKSAA